MTNYSAFHWSEKARKYAETIGTIFNVKGRVNTVADLPISGNKVGDLYLVGLSTDADLTEYAWLSFDGTTRWEKLGSTATSLAFSAITGSPNDNVALKNALDGKYSTSNPDGYISGITSAMVTTALGYTPYNSSNPSGYISGITSAMVTTALGYTPQQQLVSGTNIKTINNNSILGSGNLTLDGLPSQTGQNGKFLTTNGISASWDNIPSDSTKANTSADNFTTTAKETIVGWGMPSGTTIDVAFLPSGSHYTAPQNGFYCIGLNMGSGWANVSTSGGFLLPFKAGATYGSCIVPMKKGQEMWIDYYGVSKSTLLFVYTGG